MYFILFFQMIVNREMLSVNLAVLYKMIMYTEFFHFLTAFVFLDVSVMLWFSL